MYINALQRNAQRTQAINTLIAYNNLSNNYVSPFGQHANNEYHTQRTAY